MTDPKVKDPLPRSRRDYFYYRGVRYLEEPIQFNICFHCSNGGIRLDENGMSTVPGLYSAGECASGPRGAKNTKGKKAPDLRPETIRKALDEINRFSSMQGSEKPGNVTKDLKTLAWDNILVHINENTLDTALDGTREIRDNRLNNMKVENTEDLIDAPELNNLVQVGEVLALASRMRKEDHLRLWHT